MKKAWNPEVIDGEYDMISADTILGERGWSFYSLECNLVLYAGIVKNKKLSDIPPSLVTMK